MIGVGMKKMKTTEADRAKWRGEKERRPTVYLNNSRLALMGGIEKGYSSRIGLILDRYAMLLAREERTVLEDFSFDELDALAPLLADEAYEPPEMQDVRVRKLIAESSLERAKTLSRKVTKYSYATIVALIEYCLRRSSELEGEGDEEK